MFNKCHRWQRKISQKAEEALSKRQRKTFQNHLAQCADCRAFRAENAAMREDLKAYADRNDCRASENFDDSLIMILRAMPPVRLSPFAWMRRALRTQWNALPFAFLQQILSGALAAAVVTVICMLAAMNPKSLEARSDAASVRNEPPVPLESLLRDTSPRAALMWTPPAGFRSPRPQPAARKLKAKETGRQGSIRAAHPAV